MMAPDRPHIKGLETRIEGYMPLFSWSMRMRGDVFWLGISLFEILEEAAFSETD